MKSLAFACLLLPFLGACSSARSRPEETEATPRDVGVGSPGAASEPAAPSATSARAVLASSPRPGAKASPSSLPKGRDAGLDDYELTLWNDPKFKKRFVESFVAETEIEPRVTSLEREAMEKILELISSNEIDQAMARLQKERGRGASAVFDFTLAGLYLQRDDFERAAAEYQVAVEKYPKFRRAWQNLGICYARLERVADLVPALTRVIELGGADAVTYGVLGNVYSSLSRHLAAESAFRMASLMDADSLDWRLGMARSFLGQKRFADAAALCEELIAETPDNVDLWKIQANAFIGQGRADAAAENFELLDRLGHSTRESLNVLGDIHVNQELYDMAGESYLRALERESTGGSEQAIRGAKILMARGALVECERLVDAVESQRGSQLEDDERIDLLKLHARIAVAQGEGEEHARVLEEIVALDPLDGEALILLGKHAERMGRTEKGIFYFERAANIESSEVEACIEHARVLVNRGSYDQAIPLLERAQRLKPRDTVQEYLDNVRRIAQSS